MYTAFCPSLFSGKVFCCLQITFSLDIVLCLSQPENRIYYAAESIRKLHLSASYFHETFFRTKDDVDGGGCIITIYITSPVIRSKHDFGYRITSEQNQSHKVTAVFFYFIYCGGSFPVHMFRNPTSETCWVLYFKHTQSVYGHHKTLSNIEYYIHLQIPRGFRSLSTK